MERRWNKRRAIEVDVRVTRAGESAVTHKSCDVSLEGMCVRNASDPYSVGTFLELEFSVSPDAPPIHIHGIVAHASSRGMGVMFNHNSVRQVRMLKEYVDNRPPRVA